MAERDYTVNIKVESQEATRSVTGFFTELNQAAELAKKAFQAASNITQEFFKVVERGGAVNSLTASFERLNTQGIQKLRESTQGLITDFDLMRSANAAAGIGLKPEQFNQLAAAADALADTVGGDTVAALDSLVAAAGRGNDRMLAQYGIVVDNKKAIDDYAKAHGGLGENLNETGRRLAMQEAILKAVAEKQKELGTQARHAGDSVDELKVAWTNFGNSLASSIANSSAVIEFIDLITQKVKQLQVVLQTAERTPILSGQQGANSAQSLWNGVPIIGPLIAQIDGYQKSIVQNQGAVNRLITEEAAKRHTLIGTMGAGLGLATKTTEAIFEAGKGLEEAAKKQQEWNQVLEQLNVNELAADISKAIDSLDQTDFDGLKARLYKATYDSFIEANKDLATGQELIDAAARNAQSVISQYDEQWASTGVARAQEEGERLKDAFQEASDFWQDLWGDFLTGQFEFDNLEDALKRAAAGFAGTLTASIVGGVGVSSAQGLGEALATSMADYFNGSGIVQLKNGGWGAGAGVPAGQAVGMGSAIGGTAQAGGWMALIAGITQSADIYFANQDNFNSGDATDAEYSYITNHGHSPAQFSLLGQGLAGLFGGNAEDFSASGSLLGAFNGSEKLMQERLDRQGILQWLVENTGIGSDLSFQGVGGTKTLSPNDYTIEGNTLGSATGQSVGLVSGLADLFSGGKDKLGDDLTAIFQGGIDAGQNFNEMLVNALSLLDDLDVTAEEAKQGVTDLFLDGSISLEEFSTDIAGLNTLMQGNLVGEGSISEALSIVFNNLEQPKLAVKGLELAWAEMSEVGITSLDGLAVWLSNNFQVDATSAFNAIEAAGITSFTDLKSLSAEQLIELFKILTVLAPQMQQALGGSIATGATEATTALGILETAIKTTGTTLETVFTTAAGEAATEVGRQFGRIIGDLEDIQEAAEKAGGAVEGVGGGGRGNGGGGAALGTPGGATRRTVYPSVNRLNRAEL